MTSKSTKEFWACFSVLPVHIQKLARSKYKLWKRQPLHPSLHFKPLKNDIWSVRITLEYRALALRRRELIVWFWIGSHADYDKLLSR